MKIWILSSETPFFNAGGIARYVDNFARYFAASGHYVTVFGRAEQEEEREIVPGYCYHAVVPDWKHLGEESSSPLPDEHPSWPYNTLDYWSAFSYQLAEVVIGKIRDEGPPDVIESQEYGGIAYYLLQRRLTERGPLRNIPIILNAHSLDFLLRRYNEEPAYRLNDYWVGQLEKASLLAADSVIAPSAYFCRQIEEIFDDSSFKVEHFPLPWTESSRKPDGKVDPDPRKLLYFGRLEIRKGVLRLLEECRILWNQGVDFQLSLIGADTPYYPRSTTIQAFVESKYEKEINEGKLKIPGAMSHEKLMDEIEAAGTIVIPSIWENWPNTCIESMTMGKVVVASVHGGQAEMIGEDDKCGFLFDWSREGSCLEALKEALALNENERKERGKLAQERIAKWCRPDVVIRQRVEHFEKVIREHKRGRVFPFVNEHLRHSKVSQTMSGSDAVTGLLSVIIPYYNLGELVKETIQSVINSDYKNVEILLINDGNTDDASLKTLAELRESGIPNLRIIDIENGGLANARNVGADAARGQFIALLDADDLVEPSFFDRAIDILHDFDNVHIVYCWERYFEASNDIYPCWNFEFPYLLAHNMTNPITVIYRDSYRRFGRQKKKFAYNLEDHEGWISMVAAGCGGVSINEMLCRYRIRNNSIWQGSSRDQHLHLYNLLVDEHPELYRKYGAELFLLQNANGPAQKWLKPCTNSPFDEFEAWSNRRITYEQKQAERWWRETLKMDETITTISRDNLNKNQALERLEADVLRLKMELSAKSQTKGENKS